ncbi:sensor histidine kinase [Maribellus maritimus]|uniref:sensor histidine kinase n=1 Tax=Maribellus maritimus TaxID=2870838 RepID=UPI001EE9FA28|nr:ATP-binding protein [Maribellus maritimus]MCG6186230.1 HAMP domain-containing protein [Maribellus maritimus]
MIKWKNLLIVHKLVISYSLIILVFLAAGFFIWIGINRYKKELSFTTSAYIPLVENTNKIERLTNQSMSYLWRFMSYNDIEYYNTSKSTLSELSHSLEETERIINLSPELSQLKSRLMRIKNWRNELDIIVDETAEIQEKLQRNKEVLQEISVELSEESENIISKEEMLMYTFIRNDSVSRKTLEVKHREIRRINLFVRKGNSSMITALEAISSKKTEHLKSTINEFQYIFNLIEAVDTFFVEAYQIEAMQQFKNYYKAFQDELYSLQKNLEANKALSVRQTETANVVIYEARAMGDDGIRLSSDVFERNYLGFYRLTLIFVLGLVIALILATIFSVIITSSITVPLAKSVKFAEEIASGNLNVTVQIENEDEVGILARSLENMGVKLKENLDNLQRVERKMLTVSIDTEEAERKRLAQDLHDSLGPLLSTIKLFINALKDPLVSHKKRTYLINNAENIIEEAILSAKNVAHNLLPNLLSDFGLDVAVKSFCDQIQQVTNIKIDYSSKDYSSNFNRKVETMLFWVLKELLNNTVKHSGANKIYISMYFEKDFFHINYSDNGKGFYMDKENLSESSTKLGLTNIFNRVKYIGGNIHFESEEGVLVKIWLDKKKLE